MNKKLLTACLLAITISISGCTFPPSENGNSDGGDGGGVIISTNSQPISTNDNEIIEEYYDSNLTPGDDGSDLTE